MRSFLDILKKSDIFTQLTNAVAECRTIDVFGITPSFKPFLLAALSTLPNRGVLWISASWDSCEKIYESSHPFFNEGLKERFAVFPEITQTTDQDFTPSLRLQALKLLADERPAFIVTPFKSLLQDCETPGQLQADSIYFKPGADFPYEQVVNTLEEMGYSRTFEIEKRGDYSRRGGILDIYPSTSDPVRIEFFGDEIDSIRSIDLDSQISTGKLDSVLIYPIREYQRKNRLLDIIPEKWLIVIDDPSVIKFHAVERTFDEEIDLWGDFQYALKGRNLINVASWSGDTGKGIIFNTRPLDSAGGDIEKLLEQMTGWQKEGERIAVSTQHYSRFKELFREKSMEGLKTDPDKPVKPGQILLVPGDFHAGFLWEDEKVRFITDKEILGSSPRRKRVLRAWDKTKAVRIGDLKPGDTVVHLSHGIGKFVKLAHLTIQGNSRDFLEVEYSKGDRLFVPVQQLDLLQKYIGPEGKASSLSKLGGAEWTKTRAKAKAAADEIAGELIRLYAEREQTPGFAYSQDSPWQWELEASFPFEETDDQDRAIENVKQDLESPRPMDRLLCGDAGYGKTEVALRAAFKATQDGRQVALLTPTTILASQHFETFHQRLSPFPIKVAMLSRFNSRKEQKETIEKLKTKEVDIIIGTHRLLQKDIEFRDLGLIIVDEEQHFGVKHKEKLKNLKVNVDVLTMTATPIPRTLNMAMSGIRDLSVIETPPADRLPVKTFLYEYDSDLVRSAIIRELERGGQVYFIHNRVQNIEKIAQDIRRLVPFAKIGVGHGQMHETELEVIMLDFYEGNYDVLVCTTIVESGIDIPNVNTIIINNAQNFGLGQLYQLRGRVGRSNHQAYSYMLYPPHMSLTEDAQKRLEVIRDFSHLGAGLQIAMKDLEIRGAGNILGAEQSGYIAAVGFDLYCQILKEAVEEKRGIGRERKIEPPQIDLPVDTYIPDGYIQDSRVKLEMYRKISNIDKIEDIDGLIEEFKDRFGPIPEQLLNLIELLRIKLLAWDIGAPYVKESQGGVIILLPGVQSLPLKRIQELYEKSGLAARFNRSILAIADIFGGVSKSIIPTATKKDPPKTWIPKLENLMQTLLEWKKKKII